MKKCVLSIMLLMLISFSLFIGPSEETAQFSFNPTDEPTITTVDTIASSDVITESVQTLIPKWQTEFLFPSNDDRSEEHTSELQSRGHLVCRLLLEKKNKK